MNDGPTRAIEAFFFLRSVRSSGSVPVSHPPRISVSVAVSPSLSLCLSLCLSLSVFLSLSLCLFVSLSLSLSLFHRPAPPLSSRIVDHDMDVWNECTRRVVKSLGNFKLTHSLRRKLHSFLGRLLQKCERTRSQLTNGIPCGQHDAAAVWVRLDGANDLGKLVHTRSRVVCVHGVVFGAKVPPLHVASADIPER